MPSLLWVYNGSLVATLGKATWLETAKGLHRLGWQVTIAASAVPEEETAGVIQVVRLPRPHVYALGYLVFVAALLRYIAIHWRKLDIVLFHQDSGLFLLPLAALRRLVLRRGPRFVMDTRTMPMTRATPKDRVRAVFFAAIHRLANLLADGQTAITWLMAEAVGIPAQQLLGVWPSGVKLEQFSEAAAAHAWPGEGQPVRLIYIGALYAERNLLGVCQAVRQAQGEGLSVTLDLVGSGPQRAVLEDYARMQSDGAVRVCAPVPHEQIPGLLAKSHIGVLPWPDTIEFRVSSPIKLLEYMAAGMPILATHMACHTDVVGDMDFAFWTVDPSVPALLATIRQVCANRGLLAGMGQRALLAAQDWSWDAAASKLSVALHKLLQTPKRVP